jgi:putative membrane protein
MYVRRNIRASHVFNDSWRFLLAVGLWSGLIVYLFKFQDAEFLAVPFLPVSTIGIAVALYLGFKSNSSYGRWWEARQIWGAIINDSRSWGNVVCHLVHDESGRVDHGAQRDLIRRHIAWVNALAYQLRITTRLKVKQETRIFDYRRDMEHHDFHQRKESYLRYLESEEIEIVEKCTNPATQILRLQGAEIRDLTLDGQLDTYREVAMTDMISRFYDSQGKCERIDKTPFPRQIAFFGTVFTWLFVVLLPFGFLDAFQKEVGQHNLVGWIADDYMFALVPFVMLISWVFYIMEKVSDSTEDPFEGGVHHVPVSALSTTIEIDLKQMIGMDDVPEPLKPIGDVLY